MSWLDAAVAVITAVLASLVLVPLMAQAARRVGAVDAPDGRRKSQALPVPLGGGLAVALAALIGMIAALGLLKPSGLGPSEGYWNSAVPSAIVLVLVGLVDDLIGLTGIYKLVGQVLSASLLAAAGFHFQGISLLGWYLPLGDFSIPFSIFFCLGAINAFNLIDGSDALASSIGAVVCFTLGVIAATQNATVASLASFGMAGALVGFLRYNAPPARIYLGDTGSMLIGWLVACVAIRCSIKEQAAQALFVPIAICAIPILDAAAAMIRRITTGQSIFTPDRGHLHHALMLRGWSAGQTAAVAAGLTAITCTGAILSYFTDREIYALASAGSVVVALAATRVFGHAELSLVRSHLQSLTSRVARRVRLSSSDAEGASDHAVQLQGHRQWAVIWTALREAAVDHRLASLKLNVNIPHLHESFYASWRSDDSAANDGAWRMALPLSYGDRLIGRLLIAGRVGGKSLAEMQSMIDFLEPLESEIARLIEEVEADQASTPAIRRLGSPSVSRTTAAVAIPATDYY
jgi:UDP-GlcNAc:undecaprenyl-phosphate GlcNAc-1-phosphate transferase